MTRDQILQRIAREILDIETLDTRNADRLDFHIVSVWSLRQALIAAHTAGIAAANDAMSDE